MDLLASLSQFIPFGLIIIMFGMGLSLTLADFKRVITQPTASLAGLGGQMVALPLIGWLTAILFQLEAQTAVGVIILVCCAGGATSNLFSYLAKADTALSVTLTAASSCITIITLPIVVNLALNHFMGTEAELSLPVGQTIQTLATMTVIPVVVGMILYARFPKQVSQIEPWVKKLSLLVLGLIVLPTLVNAPNTVAGHLTTLVPALFFLNFASMLCGHVIAKALSLNPSQTGTLTIEVGVQNVVTAFFVAANLIGDVSLSVPAAVYAIPMVLNAVLYILWARRQVSP
ncbi:MAG: bile acid:sodium symporter family protein [Halieaceae bacterium]|nr:bile acid:sodium symporter family protein [Halieaceae bacterium]